MIKLIYILLCLIWGSTWLAIKIGLTDAPPIWSVAFRFVIASLIMLLVNKLRKVAYPKEFREWIILALPGLAIYAIPYMLVYWGETHISSALTAVLFASFPFFVAGYSIFLIKEEKLNVYRWLGLIIGFAGIIVIFYDSLIESKFIFWGAALIVAAAALSAFGTVMLRAWYGKKDSGLMVGLQIGLGAIITIIVAAIFEPVQEFKLTTKSVGALFYLAIFGSVIAFSGYYWLLKKIRTITLSLIAFITPVIAVGLGYIILSETFSTFTAVGSVLILVGVILVIKK